MGSKKQKRRFFIVNYKMKPGGAFDEFVELSKKKLGTGKIAKATVILDMVNKEVVKCTLPKTDHSVVPYEKLERHYRKWYNGVRTTFANS